jgi:acyl-[acyl-carrier-protein]-phospholipid O-acyltransferase/long-chain-fatty-acid--[acyl-carrier-protein] ligase
MKKHAFAYLNFTQFLGVMNDNFFKLTLIFMLLQVQGFENNQTILALAGAIFVIPFLLFSIPAGTLADRYSKNKIVIIIKLIEVVAAIVGVVGFTLKSAFWSYSALFLLATSGAIFGPTKYGIVPELVKREKLSKSNGYLSSSTYLAIIIGTVLAGPITEVTNKNFIIISYICLLFSLIGFISSFFIPKTMPAGSIKKIPPLFFTELFKTLRKTSKIKHLTIAIFGSAYFLFIGGYTQLNIIPFAVSCLGLTDVQGSYLFLVTAIGIGLGSLVAGKLSKTKIELGISPFGALGMTLCTLLLGLCGMSVLMVIGLLFFLGFFGGIFLIPLDTYIQAASPLKERGQNVACNNFMGFLGVLIASLLLYILGEVMQLPANDGFTFLAVATSFITIIFFIFLKKPISTFFSNTTPQIDPEQ